MPRKHTLKHYKQALLVYYSAPLSDVFRQFRNGAMVFFTGLVAVYLSNQMQPSWEQELVLLGGIILVGIGFITAMLAQIRLIIGRIVQFMQNK